MSDRRVTGRLPASTAVTLRVARGELHRTFRSIVETPREAIALLVLAAIMLLFTAGASVGAYVLGRSLRAEATVVGQSMLPVGRGAVGLAWVILTLAVSVRTFAKVGDVEPSSLLLPAVPVRDLVGGKLLAEGVTLCCWLAIPLACVGGAFAVGAASPRIVLALAFVSPLVVGVAVPVGFVCGLTARHLATRYEPIVRVKTPLAIALAAAYVGVFVTGRVDSVFAALYGPLQYWPVSWLADLLVLAVPALETARSAAVAGVGFSLALLAVALTVAPRVAAHHWLSDPPRDAVESDGTAAARLEGLLVPVADRRTRSVAAAVWRRTVRSPARLVFLLYPAFFAIEPARRALESLQATGTLPAWVPPLVLVYVVWAAGMAFTLNSLGDLGATLPTTVSVPDGARSVVRGRLLLALVACLPPSLALVGLAAALSPLPATGVVGLLAATAAGVVATAALATGIGVAFPRFGAVSVTRNRRVVVPSKTAAALYSLAALALVASLSALVYEPALTPVATVLSWLSGLLGGPTAVGVDTIRLVVGVFFLPFVLAPALSYRYAVSRMAAYTLE